jgi:DNA topoisomerase I
MNLLIVESPTKAKTISKYLGKDFEVVASMGHIRDLPTSKLGVDVEKNFAVDYVLDKKKSKVLVAIKQAAGKADQIVLAMDPDREGEAIAYHVGWYLRNKAGVKKEKIGRASFHEITKEAVMRAMEERGSVDMDLVDAQQGRRVLDRLVGYKLSPLLWKKVRRGLSAGRVQSVALRLICEREKEIEAFKKRPFFRIWAVFKGDKKEVFVAELWRMAGERVKKTGKEKLFDGDYSYSYSLFSKKEEVDNFFGQLRGEFKIESIVGRESKRHPLPPFTTSKLQQGAARRWGWSGKMTMRVAQDLYERGLITYHRTDSFNLADKAVEDLRGVILKKWGKEYLSLEVRRYKNRSKLVQEAHEAIRPTDASKEAGELGLNSRQEKLYKIIRRRALACQAAAAVVRKTKMELKNSQADFLAEGVQMVFPGFLAITGEKFEDNILPRLKEGEVLESLNLCSTEQETSPPPRYSEASLVSCLEKQGIGRPSTYAPIVSTILDRQYVEKEEGRFLPTALGNAANEFLVKYFSQEVDLPFTAQMEEGLDRVALGEEKWQKLLTDFWGPFAKKLKDVEGKAERVKIETEKTGDKCPECKKGDVVIRVGRFGKFKSCSRFPDCKYTAQFVEEAGFLCPDCGKEGVVRRTRRGKTFFGCSGYPKCKWAAWKKPS